MKREAMKKLQEDFEVLIRDASDDRYPFLDSDEGEHRMLRGRWKPYTFRGCFHDGLHFLYRRHLAFIGKDGRSWDYAETINDAAVGSYRDPWNSWPSAERAYDMDERQRILALWEPLTDEEKGWYEAELVIPYDRILAIDESGDEYFDGPHIYVPPFSADSLNGPFDDHTWTSLKSNRSTTQVTADPDLRIVLFPRLDGGKPTGIGNV